MKAPLAPAFLLILLGTGAMAQEPASLASLQAPVRTSRTFAGKAGIATLESFGLNAVNGLVLFALPREVTHWPDNAWSTLGSNFKRAYTSPPVWDKDDWTVNYVGHPLQGAYYFNTLRSQNCSFLASAAFNLFHTLVWEYVLEAGLEQPSAQDLITTPLAGIALGELAHFLTQKMHRGGFTTAEKILVTVINPAYVINNGYR